MYPRNRYDMENLEEHTTIHIQVPVTGMTCAACALSVEKVLKKQEGVENCAVNFANETVQLTIDGDKTSIEKLQSKVQSVGYDLILPSEDTRTQVEAYKTQKHDSLKRSAIGSAMLGIPVSILGMFFMNEPWVPWVSWILSTPVVFYFGKNFFFNAWKQALHGSANMDTLVAVSTGVAYFFSVFTTLFPEFWHHRGLHAHIYFEASAIVIVFVLIGKLLEENAKSNTSSAIKKLIGFQPKTVWLIVNGEEQQVPIDEVRVGDRVVVKPGERIAVDGKALFGHSFVDESMISGEPIPVEKSKGTKVFSGTINQQGTLKFLAEKVGSETLLSQIIKRVQEAQGSKAPIQKLVDKIASVFVPVVLGIAIVTFISWMVFGGTNAFSYALITSVSVLVIACPCALGLATPTAIMVGIGKAAEEGMLIKDAESLELAHRLDTIVLDKTGTLTEGKPSIKDSFGLEDSHIIDLFVSVEQASSHPLAQAIIPFLKEKNGKTQTLSHFENVVGKGVKAVLEETTYFLGSVKWMRELGIYQENQLYHHWQNLGYTTVFLANEKQILAGIALEDTIKPDAKKAISALQESGIEIVMLTGDNHKTAQKVAIELGITQFKAEVLPSDKSKIVREFQQKGNVVGMVGDGINDSEALAQADVSIAMSKGSDVAMDVAKITLISDQLTKISEVINLSKRTQSIIQQNLFWAFIYNIIGIPIAAGVLFPINGFLMNPMLAGAAMAFSSVSVVTNSLRLKR